VAALLSRLRSRFQRAALAFEVDAFPRDAERLRVDPADFDLESAQRTSGLCDIRRVLSVASMRSLRSRYADKTNSNLKGTGRIGAVTDQRLGVASCAGGHNDGMKRSNNNLRDWLDEGGAKSQ